MKVYILMHSFRSGGCSILGIYGTREKAERVQSNLGKAKIEHQNIDIYKRTVEGLENV